MQPSSPKRPVQGIEHHVRLGDTERGDQRAHVASDVDEGDRKTLGLESTFSSVAGHERNLTLFGEAAAQNTLRDVWTRCAS